MPFSVLIVEDVDEMRLLLEQVIAGSRKLRISGLAKNGFEARLEVARRRPDLVLLDEILPGESSFDLLHDLKEQGVPVILITGLEEPSPDVPPEALGRLKKPSWNSMAQDLGRIEGFILNRLKIA